jgi:hypothetical protein
MDGPLIVSALAVLTLQIFERHALAHVLILGRTVVQWGQGIRDEQRGGEIRRTGVGVQLVELFLAAEGSAHFLLGTDGWLAGGGHGPLLIALNGRESVLGAVAAMFAAHGPVAIDAV